MYTNIQYPFALKHPCRTPARNPSAHLRTSFATPRAWAGRRAVLHFAAADSCAIAWLNGALVGAWKDSRLPAEFDVTRSLAPCGQPNVLSVVVVRWSDGAYLEDQARILVSSV